MRWFDCSGSHAGALRMRSRGLLSALMLLAAAGLCAAQGAGLQRAPRTEQVAREPVREPAPATPQETPAVASDPGPEPDPAHAVIAPSTAAPRGSLPPAPGAGQVVTVGRLQTGGSGVAVGGPAPTPAQAAGGVAPVVVVGPMVTAQAAPYGVMEGAEAAGVSEPPAGARVLTPAEAARIALENSTDLVITAAGIGEAQAEVLRAMGLDQVQVGLSAGTSLRRVRSGYRLDDDGEPVPTSGGTDTSWQAALSASKTLYTGGRIRRTQQAAELGVEAARISEAVVRRVLHLMAHEAAYEVLRTEQLAHVAVQQAVAVNAHLELSRQLLEAGTVARFEVVQAETELARSQGRVIAARTQMEHALSTLKRLLTLPQDTRVAVASPEAEMDVPDGTLQEFISRAVERRPEVREARLAISMASLNVALARDSRNVSVSMDGSVSESDSGSGPDWQVALTLRKPILDGQAERSEVARARARLSAAEARLTATEEDVAREVAHSHIALQDARERLRVARQGVVEARERMEIAVVRYETGYALGIEVLDARTALTEAEAELVNSQYNLQVSVTQLRSALGDLGKPATSPAPDITG